MNTNTNIKRYIVQCDPGFVGYTDTGDYRLLREDDNGNEREVVMAPAEYDEEHPASTDEEFFALLHITMDNISGTQITPTGDMIDVLLDLRSLFVDYKEQHKNVVKSMMEMLQYQRRTVDFYTEQYGEVEIPEEWQPQWILEMDARLEAEGV